MGGNVNRTRLQIVWAHKLGFLELSRESRMHTKSSFLYEPTRIKTNHLAHFLSYLRTILQQSRMPLEALAVGLPLQNDLTKVPEAKVPAAIRWNNTAHTIFAFKSLDPIHSYRHNELLDVVQKGQLKIDKVALL